MAYVRQESNLHALLWAPESESGTSPKFRHGRSTPLVRSAGLEPARPERAPGFEPGASALNSATSADATTVQFSKFERDRPIRLGRRGAHGLAGCVASSMVLRGTIGCLAKISAKNAVLQRNWVQQPTGMSGDVPGRENSEAEIFMRVFFWPLLPAGARAHCWDGRLAG